MVLKQGGTGHWDFPRPWGSLRVEVCQFTCQVQETQVTVRSIRTDENLNGSIRTDEILNGSIRTDENLNGSIMTDENLNRSIMTDDNMNR